MQGKRQSAAAELLHKTLRKVLTLQETYYLFI